MKRGTILNQELSRAIAGMGHGEMMMVCDAGFPIPRDAWRVDLAVVQDVPDLETVLKAIAAEFIAEKVVIAEEMAENNPVLTEKVKRLFSACEYGAVPHQEMLTTMPARAKVILRTGAFDPWGNIALFSGVDVPIWFAKPGTVVPEYYRSRMT